MRSDQPGSHGTRPSLPPRPSNANSQHLVQDVPSTPPPAYDFATHQQLATDKAIASRASQAEPSLGHNDPRSSSQDSLLPESHEHDQRRKLLLIYIHGFMGNETSFRSFPAHVHNLLTVLVGESHVVHSKLYPRYRSRGSITSARDNFSRWLQPHENVSTDIVLLGHSMGGLLAADVALAPSPPSSAVPLRHRILGIINFDVPFLGMNTGVVKSGLASIFKPPDEPDDKWEDQSQQPHNETQESRPEETANSRPSRIDTLWGKIDPNYNPKFANDVALPVRKGWQNAWHFVNKHSDDLVKSTKKLVASHMEFGGAMANYNELKTRYARVRALEEEDPRIRQTVVGSQVPPRVRFVNYYTSSTGRRKKSRSRSRSHSRPNSLNTHGDRPSSRASGSRTSLLSSNSQDVEIEINSERTQPSLSNPHVALHQRDKPSTESHSTHARASLSSATSKLNDSGDRSSNDNKYLVLPDLPPAPPALGDLSYIQDEHVRKLVIDEHHRAVQRYEKILQERESILQLRQGIDQKPAAVLPVREEVQHQKHESEMTHSEREAIRLEREKERVEAEGRRLRGETKLEAASQHSLESIPRIESRTPSMPASTVDSVSIYDSSMLTPQHSLQSTDTASTSTSSKAKKDRNFCNLPPKDKNGQLDPCWVRVLMENVDEVGAHCGLFFVDERYERLVGDVAERVERWVLKENSVRASMETGSSSEAKSG